MRRVYTLIEAALRGMLRRRFLPSPWTYEDVLQQVHLHLLVLLGPNYLDQIEAGGEEVDVVLKRAVARAIGNARWRWEKRRQRGLPVVMCVGEQSDVPASEPNRVALLKDVFERLDDDSKLLIEMKRAGHSTSEISSALGCSRAEYYRRYTSIIQRLRAALSDEDDQSNRQTGA